jgi:hypothetical protein
MSQGVIQGGYFTILANDNEIDKYLLNKDFLNKRINEIKNKKIKIQQNSINTRLTQIENIKNTIRNNILSVEDINKYNDIINQLLLQIERLEVKSVNPDINEINETHAIFLRNIYKPIVSVGYGYFKTSNNRLPILNSTIKFRIPINGNFVTDMILYFKLSQFSATHNENRVKYCDFPGHRLLKNIRFIIDNVVIDSYGTEEINFYYDFHVPNSQKNGWKRCVGQEIPKRAFFTQDPKNQEMREQKMIHNGAQTPKHTQDELELFIPLNFWFCDPKFALSNRNLTYDKCFIEVDLASYEELTTIYDYANDGGIYIPPKFIDYGLYSNHIYMIKEVESLFNYSNTFNIIRVHNSMSKIVDKSSDSILLNNLKLAVENIKIVFRPLANNTNENAMETWNNNNNITYKELPFPSIIKVANISSLGSTKAYYYEESPTIDTLGLSSSGNSIYDNNPVILYDSYLPFRYGKNVVITPYSSGSFLLTFNLYPHKDQSSGYINLSNTRDTYLIYNSSFINSNNPCRLFLSVQTINFLVLDEGTMSPRFIV